MWEWLLLGGVGFGAQLINSALGMGYGVSSTTFLLSVGTAPALAAATVNFSQVGSQLVSGFAHWRLGNVDWRITWRIGLPGAVGAFVGATFLSWLATAAAAPVMAGILIGLGCYILLRFTLGGMPQPSADGAPPGSRLLMPLGLVGGFLNSTGGGGWGPVSTSALLVSGRAAPRTVIGSISASEFAVVTAGSVGFLLGLGLGGVNLGWVLAMLIGGVLAAPAAAWLARHLPARLLGTLVGGFIVVTNVRNLLASGASPAPGWVQAVVLGSLTAGWGLAVWVVARAHRRPATAEPAEGQEPATAEVSVDIAPARVGGETQSAP